MSSASSSPIIVWFRQDLRLQDNPALAAAVAEGRPVVPVYILDDRADEKWKAGGASRWWLHHALASLDDSLRSRESRLVLRRGDSGDCLRRLIEQTGAGAVHWNRCYEPAIVARDKVLKATLGVEVKSFNASLLFEPHTIQNKAGLPFKVFTPFWRHCLSLKVDDPVRLARRTLPPPARWPDSVPLRELDLKPRLAWDDGLESAWVTGEEAGLARLKRFVGAAMTDYNDQRNLPAIDGTSALSPYLHFGHLGPRQIWAAVRDSAGGSGVFPPSRGAQVFLSELGWREFAYHLLFHFPHTPGQALRAEFENFPWRSDAEHLRAWQKGRTGYPIVDAGMRQLWATGWMHNRVRMIVASFLVKHLRLSWREGAVWFWDTLVDADLASNTLGWQWTAGCGADAAPYFRIFNPILQGERFDPEGAYVRRWVPELAKLPAEFIHCPWAAPAATLATAGVILGDNYPQPIVDHGEARQAALDALQSIRLRPV